MNPCVILTGSGAPSDAPAIIGQIYIDTTGRHVYISVGITSSTDWVKVA